MNEFQVFVQQQLQLGRILHQGLGCLQSYLLTRHCPQYESAIIDHILEKEQQTPNFGHSKPAFDQIIEKQEDYSKYLLSNARRLILSKNSDSNQNKMGQEHDIYSNFRPRQKVHLQIANLDYLVIDLQKHMAQIKNCAKQKKKKVKNHKLDKKEAPTRVNKDRQLTATKRVYSTRYKCQRQSFFNPQTYLSKSKSKSKSSSRQHKPVVLIPAKLKSSSARSNKQTPPTRTNIN